MTTTVGVNLDEETRGRLQALGEARQRSTYWLMREAIRKYLDEEEAVESRNREADAAWEEYQRTSRAVSNEKVVAWLDKWGTDKESQCPAPGA